MISLFFKGMAAHQSATLGPAEGFCIAGNFIREVGTEEILARYQNHFWHVDKLCFTHYETQGRVKVHFDDGRGGATEDYGPYDKVNISNGSVYLGDKLFAKFSEESLTWHDMQSETYWPQMMLLAAE